MRKTKQNKMKADHQKFNMNDEKSIVIDAIQLLDYLESQTSSALTLKQAGLAMYVNPTISQICLFIN